jgi:hypothetical protein
MYFIGTSQSFSWQGRSRGGVVPTTIGDRGFRRGRMNFSDLGHRRRRRGRQGYHSMTSTGEGAPSFDDAFAARFRQARSVAHRSLGSTLTLHVEPRATETPTVIRLGLGPDPAPLDPELDPCN